jgi:Fe-S oxidoreductase
MDPRMSAALEELFRSMLHSAMRMYIDTCARCGNCVDSCHVYASMPEARYTAVGRAEVVRKIFKRYFRLQGRIAPWLGEVLEFDQATLGMVYDAAYSCTGCRRCMMHCPSGRIVLEAERLEVKEVAVVECGTAFRVLRLFIGERPFKVLAFVELVDRYVKQGRIRLHRDRLPERTTYRDPCQIARKAGVFEGPRDLLRILTPDFVELDPCREEYWCCGGGGGLVAMGSWTSG